MYELNHYVQMHNVVSTGLSTEDSYVPHLTSLRSGRYTVHGTALPLQRRAQLGRQARSGSAMLALLDEIVEQRVGQLDAVERLAAAARRTAAAAAALLPHRSLPMLLYTNADTLDIGSREPK